MVAATEKSVRISRVPLSRPAIFILGPPGSSGYSTAVEEEVEFERGERGGGERDGARERVVVGSGVVAIELLLEIVEARRLAHLLALARAAVLAKGRQVPQYPGSGLVKSAIVL